MIRKAGLVIWMLALVVPVSPAKGQSGNGYVLTRSTVVPGGTCTGNGYRLSGAIGQHDAGTVIKKEYELRAGYWPTPYTPDGIPTVSAWGLVILTLLLLTGLKVKFGRHRLAHG